MVLYRRKKIGLNYFSIRINPHLKNSCSITDYSCFGQVFALMPDREIEDEVRAELPVLNRFKAGFALDIVLQALIWLKCCEYKRNIISKT